MISSAPPTALHRTGIPSDRLSESFSRKTLLLRTEDSPRKENTEVSLFNHLHAFFMRNTTIRSDTNSSGSSICKSVFNLLFFITPTISATTFTWSLFMSLIAIRYGRIGSFCAGAPAYTKWRPWDVGYNFRFDTAHNRWYLNHIFTAMD